VVGAIDAISAIEAIARKNPINVPRYIHTAPPVPPFKSAKKLAENCASQVAINTIVNPKMDRNREFRCSYVCATKIFLKVFLTNPRLLHFAHPHHVSLVVIGPLLLFLMTGRGLHPSFCKNRLQRNVFVVFLAHSARSKKETQKTYWKCLPTTTSEKEP
jgi:hypothetical protein